MEERYSRNRLYVNNDEQDLIKKHPILIAGSGIGSNIAECALRFGFENITVIDGDKIEISNLNRQNFTYYDVEKPKAETLYNRLKSINPGAEIKYINEFITEKNIREIIEGHSIAINALDFTSDIPLHFDTLCKEKRIPVLHPYNLGWGGLVMVITPDGLSLESLNSSTRINELSVVEFFAEQLKHIMEPNLWLEKILKSYKDEKETLPPPQLAIGSWIIAGICTTIMYNIITNKKVKQFPDFYFNTIME
ncbi:ThiF family adenylyltransferase [Chryseobacterium shigense]|uniref:Molybdopterin/thiamine biosynthesis adenylyltransferase n=1 Tax=Chryseobacterium shigense TaxID=297244 RepID=A0A841NH61_9FLAO|nr:ThiF family adenylyltransferase [Chryseobacterium shigense]MBB6371362.1 molybdopterin/thiamine biosynthesis adenylyltransferase [Chryseobacterium shigense]